MITTIRWRYHCIVIDPDKAIEMQLAEIRQSSFVIAAKNCHFVKVYSYGTICDYDLLLLLLGCTGVMYNPLAVIRKIAVEIAQCERTFSSPITVIMNSISLGKNNHHRSDVRKNPPINCAMTRCDTCSYRLAHYLHTPPTNPAKYLSFWQYFLPKSYS